MGYLAVAVAAVLWGTWSLYLRPSGMGGAAVSFVLFALMSLPALLARRPLWRGRRAGWALVALGLGDAANAVLYFEAVRRGPVAIAVLTHYLAPLLVAVAGPLVLGEAPSRRARIAAPLSLLGLYLVVHQPGVEVPVVTAALGAASALFYGANVIASKAAARGYSALEVTALHAPISAAAVLAGFGAGALPPAAGAPLLRVLVGCAVAGLGATLLFNLGLRRIPSSTASALTYLEPLTAAVVGYLAFAEPLGSTAVVGAAAILGSGVWVVLEPRPGSSGPRAGSPSPRAPA